jgi:hypothetical protein
LNYNINLAKNIKIMKKITLITFLFACIHMNAQVGIGTTAPDGGSMLDVFSADKGILVPRVNLTSLSTISPITGSTTTSLLVYNTNATTGTGFYYWNNTITRWVKIDGGNDWSLTGNAGTTAGTNFIGTTDAVDFRIKTNNTNRWNISNANSGQLQPYSLGTAALPIYSFQSDTNTGIYSSGADALDFSTNGTGRMRVLSDGRVAINNAAPTAGDLFSVTTGGTINYAVNGYNGLATGSAIYGQNSNTSNTYSAIEGTTASGTGAGVLGISTGATTASQTPTGVVGQYSGTSNSGTRYGVRGYSGQGGGNLQIGVQGSYKTLGWGIGVAGLSIGGALPSGNNDIAVLGWRSNNGNYSGYFNGNHVIANGTKSASVGTSKGNQLLYVTEAPEVWFEDIGGGKLANGSLHIDLDPLFLETIFVDESHPMRIFLQEEGESNGLIVVKDTDNKGFTVKEKNGGTSNISFSYRIMAKRLHFQDHRFGNDSVWGSGDTRKYNSYSAPPPVDYQENLIFQENKKKNSTPDLLPEGFIIGKTFEKVENTKSSN